jgi:HlyD family secretion protein
LTEFASQASSPAAHGVLESAQAAVSAAEADFPVEAAIMRLRLPSSACKAWIDDADLRRSAPVAQYVPSHTAVAAAAGSASLTLTDLSDMYMTIYLLSREMPRRPVDAFARSTHPHADPATVTFVAHGAPTIGRDIAEERGSAEVPTV